MYLFPPPRLPDEPTAGWCGRLRSDGNFKNVKSAHYSLYHNLDAEDGEPVKRRLDRLEDAFRVWYYWWALKTD